MDYLPCINKLSGRSGATDDRIRLVNLARLNSMEITYKDCARGGLLRNYHSSPHLPRLLSLWPHRPERRRRLVSAAYAILHSFPLPTLRAFDARPLTAGHLYFRASEKSAGAIGNLLIVDSAGIG